MLRAVVNGQSREFTEGSSILKGARSLGIEVPTLCRDRHTLAPEYKVTAVRIERI